MKSFKAEFSEAMSRNPDAKLVEGEELRRLQRVLVRSADQPFPSDKGMQPKVRGVERPENTTVWCFQ